MPDGWDALGLGDPNSGFVLPTGNVTPTGGDTFSAGGVAPVSGPQYSMGQFSGGGDGIMGLIEKNPGLLLSGGLLATQLFKGNQPYPAETQLQGLAGQTSGTAAALTAPLFTGNLPPGAKQAVDSATNAAKADTRARYGKLGLAGSTMEGQALGNVDRQAAAQTFQIADQLLKQGMYFTGLTGTFYNDILKSQMSTDADLQKSLMTFAGGLSGLRGTSSSPFF